MDLTLTTYAAIVGLGLTTLFANVAWQSSANRVGTTTAGVFINIEPLIGALTGVVLFDDRMSLGLGLGGAMILTGSVAVVLGERNATAPIARDVPATPT